MINSLWASDGVKIAFRKDIPIFAIHHQYQYQYQHPSSISIQFSDLIKIIMQHLFRVILTDLSLHTSYASAVLSLNQTHHIDD